MKYKQLYTWKKNLVLVVIIIARALYQWNPLLIVHTYFRCLTFIQETVDISMCAANSTIRNPPPPKKKIKWFNYLNFIRNHVSGITWQVTGVMCCISTKNLKTFAQQFLKISEPKLIILRPPTFHSFAQNFFLELIALTLNLC